MGIMISVDTKEISRREVERIVFKMARVLYDEYGDQLKFAILDSELRKMILKETSGRFLDEENGGLEMKKDLAWLKEEVRNCEYITEHDIRRLSDLIDQVEQPAFPKNQKIVINPAELFNQRNDVRQYMRIDIRDEQYDNLADKYGFNTVDQIVDSASIYFKADEIPQEIELELVEYKVSLPEIPDYVAEWIEYLKDFGEAGLPKPQLHNSKVLRDKQLKIDKAQSWIRRNYKKYCTAYAMGYLVEERKYYVLGNSGDPLIVWVEGGKIEESSSFNDSYHFHSVSDQFTEQEIKDYDERYWPFAVQVEELEE